MATQYKPILFSTEMVQAILEGRKTQTRRIMTDWGQHSSKFIISGQGMYVNKHPKPSKYMVHFRYPEDLTDSCGLIAPIQPGDILWVRETFFNCSSFKEYPLFSEIKGNFCYKTNDFIGGHKWKPSIHMPKEAARIFLEVTNVRVERLRDISEEDAIAEGFGPVINDKYPAPGKFINHLNNHHMFNAICSFASMWVKLNGKGAWKANPWVWVYDFKVVEKPKDFTNEH